MAVTKNVFWAVILVLAVVGDAFAKRDNEASAIAADVALHEQQQILSPNTKPTASDSNIKDSDSPPPTPHILIYSNGTPTPIPTNLATLHASSLFRGGPSLGESLSLAKTKAQELNLSLVASDIETWIKHHPWKAAFYAASAIGFFAPEILSIPALEMLGFGLGGVRAGTLAAKIQSVIGPVAARSVFAIWQSARMGGYGVEYVNGGVRALVALADAAVAACNPLKDCKGLISDAGERSLGVSLAATGSVLSVVCGCLVGVYNFFG